MNDKILDDFKEEQFPKYANKSFRRMILCIATYIILFLFIRFFSEQVDSREYLSLIGLTLGLLAYILSLLGLLSGIKSIIKKESSFWKKYGATLGNFLLVLIVALVLLANAIDLYQILK